SRRAGRGLGVGFLYLTQLEDLAEALLDFSSQSDLVNYLGNIVLAQPNLED
ncbi:DUF4351 domain-containing protein, partial [Nostoc sp. CCCryo 231-06]|nr:DUF4351 domain-containing protein [Nostoc sp. CCCryo 231-06]